MIVLDKMKKNNSSDDVLCSAVAAAWLLHTSPNKYIGIEAKKMFHFLFVLSWEKIRWVWGQEIMNKAIIWRRNEVGKGAK